MVIAGTRPELIKIAPILEALSSRDHRPIFAYSQQHYDGNMSHQFIKELGLPRPALMMNVGSGSHGEQTARGLIGCEKAIRAFRPDAVIAQGDTNTTLAAALASSKMKVPFGHVEAGLRSYDGEMPEEINRVLTDHVSDLLFAPTSKSAMNLRSEGISEDRIFVTGNTIVDMCLRFSRVAARKSRILERLGLDGAQNLALVTAHRAENVDSRERLRGIITALMRLNECTLIFPIHPRTRMRLLQLGFMKELRRARHIILTDPLSYVDFLRILMSSRFVLTDSGGIQEEAVSLHVPCLTMRLNTERPETLEVGANILVGTDPTRIMHFARRVLKDDDFASRMRATSNPFGDGHASERIVAKLEEYMDRRSGGNSYGHRRMA